MRDFLSYSVLFQTMLKSHRIQSGKMDPANKEYTI
jgi:hypothetical protein